MYPCQAGQLLSASGRVAACVVCDWMVCALAFPHAHANIRLEVMLTRRETLARCTWATQNTLRKEGVLQWRGLERRPRVCCAWP